MNNLALEHPEWADTIALTASYPVQKWAYDVRRKIGINDRYISTLLDSEEHDTYFGLMHKNNLKNQERMLETTTELLNLFAEYEKENTDLSNMLVKVHGIKRNIPYTPYQIRKYYRDALTDFCHKYSERVNMIIEKIADQRDNVETDMQLVYHNADTLLKTIAKMKKSRKEYQQMEIYSAILCVTQCIIEIDSYPFYPTYLSDVLRMKMEDITQSKMAELLDVSQEYISRKYNEATHILSILIWGFSSMDILKIINATKG